VIPGGVVGPKFKRRETCISSRSASLYRGLGTEPLVRESGAKPPKTDSFYLSNIQRIGEFTNVFCKLLKYALEIDLLIERHKPMQLLSQVII